jgi:hypothetical protein
MKARILLLVGVLNVYGCTKPQVSPQESTIATPAPTPRLASQGTVFLLRRVAVATEDSLHGLAAGSEVKVIEERPGKLLVETQGLQFEINQGDTTNDLDQRDMVLARAAEREAIRQAAMATPAQTEDQKFLAEENGRRRSLAEAQIAHLRSAIDLAKEEIARLEAEYNESVSSWNKENTMTPNNGRSYETEGGSTDSAENNAHRERIAVLETHIANCDREIQMLSDAMAGW